MRADHLFEVAVQPAVPVIHAPRHKHARGIDVGLDKLRAFFGQAVVETARVAVDEAEVKVEVVIEPVADDPGLGAVVDVFVHLERRGQMLRSPYPDYRDVPDEHGPLQRLSSVVGKLENYILDLFGRLPVRMVYMHAQPFRAEDFAVGGYRLRTMLPGSGVDEKSQ